MAKLSKIEAKNHAQALEYLKLDKLTTEQKDFVIKHYHEGATHINGVAGAFFTPYPLAWEFALCVAFNDNNKHRYIDICAGIGVLSYALINREPNAEIVCIDINPEYVEVGKKIVPEATWYCADVNDLDFIQSLGWFDCAYSNPPFGSVASFSKKRGPKYTGSEAEYKVIDIASMIAKNGTFILPQASAGFKYSGRQSYERDESDKYTRFSEQTGIELELSLSIDTSYEEYGKWRNCNPVVEFVDADFENLNTQQLELFKVA